MLDLAFGLTQTSRLGCQIIMSDELDGLTVTLPSATRNMMEADLPRPAAPLIVPPAPSRLSCGSARNPYSVGHVSCRCQPARAHQAPVVVPHRRRHVRRRRQLGDGGAAGGGRVRRRRHYLAALRSMAPPPGAPGAVLRRARTSRTRHASPSSSRSRITCSTMSRAGSAREVIDDFAETYLRGETPIPCVRCNQTVKFRDLLATARDLGADALATGHYVQRVAWLRRPRAAPRCRSPSAIRAISLFATTPAQLDFLRFPLRQHEQG